MYKLIILIILICILSYLIQFNRYSSNIETYITSVYHHPLFLKQNICVYFSSLNNDISVKRRRNLIKKLDNIGISFEYDKGVTKGTNLERMFYHLLQKMEKFKASNYKYGLICDDDFIPCDNFWNKLTTTMKYINPKFRCLHLCPGCLWGRKYRNNRKKGYMNSEKNLTGIKHNKYVFYDINKDIWIKKKMWLGGPIAILINKESIDSLIHEYVKYWQISKEPNDVILLKILNNNDYVCRQPQLGYENEEGGTTFI